MMKRIFILFSLIFTTIALFAAPVMQKKQPEWQGKSKNRVLILNGGRPWAGTGTAHCFAKSGLRVRCLDSRYLAGEGGATIKANVSDKIEPVPFDGITPAFKSLRNYHLVMFHAIPEKNMANILTAKNIETLKNYVSNGGHVLFTYTVPQVIADLLPVEISEPYGVEADEIFYANRPRADVFKDFPEKIPVLKSFNVCTLKPRAKALSMIHTADGDAVSPYIATWNIGSGTVSYLNAEVVYARSLKELSNWAYSSGLLPAVATLCGNFSGVNPTTMFKKLMPIVAPVQQGIVVADVAEPKLGITADTAKPVILGKTSASLSNGSTLTVDSNGAVSICWPGQKQPLLQNMRIPEIGVDGNQVTYDTTTHEATAAAAEIKKIALNWKFAGLSVANNNEIAVTYTAPNCKMIRFFKSGKMELDGRKFSGVAERVEIVELPAMIQQIQFNGELAPAEPLFVRRFSCYIPPRGYTDVDMRGKTAGDTGLWGYFGAGQPFEFLVCKNGLYMSNISVPQSVDVRMSRSQNGKNIKFYRGINFGRVKAPQTAVDYWYWFSEGPERAHNDYLAMYQFQRQNLRRAVGLKEIPTYPSTKMSHQLSQAEYDTILKKAIEVGYRYAHSGMLETALESTFSDELNQFHKSIADKGIIPKTWSAGSYLLGDSGWIYNNHPEWLVRDKNGKIFAYGGTRYPVIDLNNKEFIKWYKEVAKKTIDSGVKWIYRDMDGAAASSVNYATLESPNGMPVQIEIYKFLQDNGCMVGVEGMNPLVLDEYWYRENLYKPFTGNEFCLVGSLPTGNYADALNIDPFRTAMYGCFPTFWLAGYTYNFESIPGEIKRADSVIKHLKKINEALDLAGMPFIRETAFGTTWYGKNGGALFFCNPTKKAVINLPQGWVIDGVEGNVLTDVPAYSMYVLKKR